MSWKFQLPAGGGVLYSLGAHCLDLTSWLLSSKITSVLGNLLTVVEKKEDAETNEVKEVTADDTATIQATLGSEVQATIHVSTVNCGPPCHRIEITGTEGWLEISDNVLSGGKSDSKGARTVLVLNDQLVKKKTFFFSLRSFNFVFLYFIFSSGATFRPSFCAGNACLRKVPL